MFSDLIRGGQILAHSIQMLRQVVRKLLVYSLFITFLITYYRTSKQITPIEMRNTMYYIIAKYNVSFQRKPNKPMNVIDRNGNRVQVTSIYTYQNKKLQDTYSKVSSILNQQLNYIPIHYIISFLSLFIIFLSKGYLMNKDSFLRGAKIISLKQLNGLIRKYNLKQIKQKDKTLLHYIPSTLLYSIIKPILRFILTEVFDSITFRNLNKNYKPYITNHTIYQIASATYPIGTETLHTLITGASGTGKTVLITDLIQQIRKNGDRAIIYDRMGTFVSKFYNGNEIDNKIEKLMKEEEQHYTNKDKENEYIRKEKQNYTNNSNNSNKKDKQYYTNNSNNNKEDKQYSTDINKNKNKENKQYHTDTDKNKKEKLKTLFELERDIILNPLDQRSPHWSVFNEARNKIDFDNIASALIPEGAGNIDPFWNSAARILFSSVANKLKEANKTSNKDIIDKLLTINLTEAAQLVKGTEAQAIIDEQNPKTALSVMAMISANLRSLTTLKDREDGEENNKGSNKENNRTENNEDNKNNRNREYDRNREYNKDNEKDKEENNNCSNNNNKININNNNTNTNTNTKNNNNSFSIRQWIQNDNQKGFLFISSRADMHETLKPLISTWLDIAINSLLSLEQSNNRKIWIIIDELPSLHYLPSLHTGLAEARQFGGCFVLSLQLMAQLEAIYGIQKARATSGLCRNRVILNTPDKDTAQWCSDNLGKVEIKEVRENISFGSSDYKDGVNINQQDIQRNIVMSTEIMQLKNLNAYIKFAGEFPIALSKFKYKNTVKKNERYIERTREKKEEDMRAEDEEETKKEEDTKEKNNGNNQNEKDNNNKEINQEEKSKVYNPININTTINVNKTKKNDRGIEGKEGEGEGRERDSSEEDNEEESEGLLDRLTN
jgi:type IV secretory pathway TraG/TraD family ATPase VirD4